MGYRDMSMLPEEVRRTARARENGEVEWRLGGAPRAINALASAGLQITGLDLRSYPDGRTFEVPWSRFDRDHAIDTEANVEAGRRAALDALARDNLAEQAEHAEWILIGWL